MISSLDSALSVVQSLWRWVIRQWHQIFNVRTEYPLEHARHVVLWVIIGVPLLSYLLHATKHDKQLIILDPVSQYGFVACNNVTLSSEDNLIVSLSDPMVEPIGSVVDWTRNSVIGWTRDQVKQFQRLGRKLGGAVTPSPLSAGKALQPASQPSAGLSPLAGWIALRSIRAETNWESAVKSQILLPITRSNYFVFALDALGPLSWLHAGETVGIYASQMPDGTPNPAHPTATLLPGESLTEVTVLDVVPQGGVGAAGNTFHLTVVYPPVALDSTTAPTATPGKGPAQLQSGASEHPTGGHRPTSTKSGPAPASPSPTAVVPPQLPESIRSLLGARVEVVQPIAANASLPSTQLSCPTITESPTPAQHRVSLGPVLPPRSGRHPRPTPPVGSAHRGA